jgi:hypothetical protein
LEVYELADKSVSLLLALLKDYWAPIAAVVGVVLAFFRRTIIAKLFAKTRFRREFQPHLRAYVGGEIQLLRGWPSLVAATSIDFARDYVSLVMIEQRRAGVVGRKRSIEVEEVLTCSNPAVIVSGPGCGKTTLLLHMHYRLLAAQFARIGFFRRSIPVFLHASEIMSTNGSIRTVISRKLESLRKRDAEHLVAEGLAQGWFVLLIDGIDELDTGVPKFLQKVRRFTDHYPLCHMILASRPVSYDLVALTQNSGKPFLEIAIAPLTYEKKKALVEKYASGPDQAEEVLALISTQPFLAEITRVTINLILLINSVAYSEKISRRSDFYEQAVRVLLSSLPERKGAKQKLSLSSKLELLSRIAFEVLVSQKSFSVDTVANAGGDPDHNERVFAEIQKTSGLVRLAAPGRFEFPHRTFAEFFAGLYIVKNYGAVADGEWTQILTRDASEIVAFVANLLGSADPLIERVLRLRENRASLLATCLANCCQVDVELQKSAETIISLSLNKSSEVHVQNSSTRSVLSQIHRFPRPPGFLTIYLDLVNRIAAPHGFAKAAGSSIADVQTQALRFLIHTTSPEIVPLLIEIFRNPESDTYVRFKAGELLAGLSNEELLPDLEEAYEKNGDDDVRRFVTEAIVRTRSEMALPTLEVARMDPDPVIRDLAVEGNRQIEQNLYLEDATVVSVTGHENAEKMIIPGCDLASEETLQVALDRESSYRLDAFFQLRGECPEDREAALFELAMNPEENEFFRCEAVRLIGSRKSPKFADYLEAVFLSGHSSEGTVGAGARGCAIEYLAHRKCVDRVLGCIEDCDLRWRPSSERCKIVWSIYEILCECAGRVSPTHRAEILRVCSQCRADPNPRVHHWLTKIQLQLQDLAA